MFKCQSTHVYKLNLRIFNKFIYAMITRGTVFPHYICINIVLSVQLIIYASIFHKCSANF